MRQVLVRSLVCAVLCLKCAVPMSLGVSPLTVTRYDPCGLGIMHLDKVNSTVWAGVINFDLYPWLDAADLVVHFKVSVNVTGVSHNETVVLKDNLRTLQINPIGKIPEKIWFYMILEEDVAPTIKKLSLNNDVLCSEQVKKLQSKESLSERGHTCGRRTPQHTELVTTGGEARAGDWPWHVAIYVEKPSDPGMLSYQCGGSVVSKNIVVTAGHCVVIDGNTLQPSQVTIVAGTANLTDVNAAGRQRYEARKIVTHPSYDDSLATADLAIIKVDGFDFTEYVQPICVWGPVYEKEYLFGKYATVVGFGQTEVNSNSDILRSAYTKVQSDQTCTKYAPNLYPRLLNEFTFCAGYGPKSRVNPRNGDSGGGLVIPVQQSDHRVSWYLRGVLSKCGMEDGADVCDPKFYVVYTDVASHYSWIMHHAGLGYGSNVVW